MQSSNSPDKIVLPWANNGDKNTIPVDSQITTLANGASYYDGFPPATMTPRSSGGLPPLGEDMNGILNAITSAQRWQQSGAGYVYDSTFANSAYVGGYPKGTILRKSTLDGFWFNTVENNVTDPEGVSAAGWVDLFKYNVATSAGTSDAITAAMPITVSTISGQLFYVRANAANTSTTPTLKIDSTSTKVIVKGAGSALAVGDIAGQGHWLIVKHDVVMDKYVLLNPYSSPSLGVGQTWQNVTSSRVSGTTYTNSTTKPIQVLVVLPDTGGTATVTVVVGGITLINNVAYDIGAGSAVAIPSFIVPSGQTYSVSAGGAGSIVQWNELS